MRKILYTICLLQTGTIVYLLSIMVDHPYNYDNMSTAFDQGCKLAALDSSDKDLFNKCSTYSVFYREALKDLENQN